MLTNTIRIKSHQFVGAILASVFSIMWRAAASVAQRLRPWCSNVQASLLVLMLLVSAAPVVHGGPHFPPPGFTLAAPTPAPFCTPWPACGIGLVYRPTDYIATSALPSGFWPGPAISAFPWIDIGGGAAGLVASNIVAASLGLGVSLRTDRLVIRAPSNFGWPISASGKIGGQLWLVFGGSPFGGTRQVIQGPRSFAPFVGQLGFATTVPAVMTPAFFFGNVPPTAYAFDIILTDLDGAIAAILDPLLILGGVPPNTPPAYPLAHWILSVQTSQTVRQSLPAEIAAELRKLGVRLNRGRRSFAPSDHVLCPSDPPSPGLPSLLRFDLETGELSGPVTAPPGVYCSTYDALDVRGRKVAELPIIIAVKSGREFEVGLSVDKGCGATYLVGETLTISFRASQDALVRLRLQMPDGSDRVILSNQTVRAGVTNTLRAVVGEPGGTRRLILEAAAGTFASLVECSFTALDVDIDGDGENETVREDPNLDPNQGYGYTTDGDRDFDVVVVGAKGGARVFGTADVDGDGELELIIEDPNIDPNQGYGYDIDGDGDYDIIVVGAKGGAKVIGTADVDGDGDTEVIVEDPNRPPNQGYGYTIDGDNDHDIIVTPPSRAPQFLQVGLSVDKGCGASYAIGESLLIAFSVSQDAVVSLRVRLPDGAERVFLSNLAASTGVTYLLRTTVGEPPGQRVLTLEATAGGQSSQAQCAFTGTRQRSPDVLITPAFLDFGEVTVGGSKRLSLAVSNLGQNDLAINRIDIAGGAPSPFNFCGAPPGGFTLRPNEAREIKLCLTPRSPGSLRDEVVLRDAFGRTFSVPLVGQAIAPRGDGICYTIWNNCTGTTITATCQECLEGRVPLGVSWRANANTACQTKCR